MGKPNAAIRDAMYDHRMAQWELAELLGVSETTIWRILRKEMPEKEQNRIVWIINNQEKYKEMVGVDK